MPALFVLVQRLFLILLLVLAVDCGYCAVAAAAQPQPVTIPALREMLRADSGDILVQFTSSDPECGYCVQNNNSLPRWVDQAGWKGRFLRVSWAPWRNFPADLKTLPVTGEIVGVPSLVLFRDGRVLDAVSGNNVLPTQRLLYRFGTHPVPLLIPETIDQPAIARDAIKGGADVVLVTVASAWSCPACQTSLEDLPYRLARAGWKGRFMVLSWEKPEQPPADLNQLPDWPGGAPVPAVFRYHNGKLLAKVFGDSSTQLDAMLQTGSSATPAAGPATAPVSPSATLPPAAGVAQAAPAIPAGPVVQAAPASGPAAAVVSSLRLTPGQVRQLYGTAIQLRAQAVDAGNRPLALPSGLTWSSSDPAVASVDSTGRVQLLRRGKAVIQVKAGTADTSVQVEVLGFSQLARTSSNRACALPDDRDAVYCWGKNLWTIPLERTGFVPEVGAPTAIARGDIPPGTRLQDVAIGTFSSCVLSQEGKVYCWGNSQKNTPLGRELPAGMPANQALAPALISAGEAPAGVRFRAIGVGPSFACAAGDDRKLYCWGDSRALPQQSGSRLPSFLPTPVAVPLGELPATASVSALALSTNGGCVLAEGEVYCWSGNGLPLRIPPGERPLTSRFTHIDSDDFLCALADDGNVYCSGSAFGARWGRGTATFQQSRPWLASLRPDNAGFAAVSKGGNAGATCAVDHAGQAWCWGKNHMGSGAAGRIADVDILAPQLAQRGEVPVAVKLVDISCGQYHCTALGDDGRAYAWGSNEGLVLGRSSANLAGSGVPIVVAPPLQ